MGSRRHTPEQIINKLRQAEVELANAATVAQACRKMGVTEQTYYRWRSEYGGMRVDQAKRLEDASVLQEPEKENARLKKLVADQALDIAILKEAAWGNF
jgi:putative transposase